MRGKRKRTKWRSGLGAGVLGEVGGPSAEELCYEPILEDASCFHTRFPYHMAESYLV